MQKYISSVIYADSFACLVCLEQFYQIEQNVAVVLECGHTICKKCLKDMLKSGIKLCPIDNRTEIKLPNEYNFIENKIIHKAISLNYNLIINTKSLTKLYFYYCSDCNLFLSFPCAEVHKIIDHKVTSISSYTNEWFYYISDNISTHKITNKIKTFIVLYFFQSPYILKLKSFKIKEILSCNKKKFTFYGETIKINEKNKILYTILLSLLSNNNSDENYSLKKGMIIGENGQIIQGYFVIYSVAENYIVKGLGLTNFQGIFFGIMKFVAIPLYSGFSLEIGILDNGISYYFGKFSEKKIEFPSYEFDIGEEITFKDKFIEVQKKNKNNKNEECSEYFEHNKYFKLEEDQDKNKKLILTEHFNHSKNSNQIEIFINNNNKIQSINFISKNNNIFISKKFPYQEIILISDSIIHLIFDNVYILFMEKYLIICKSYSYEKPFYGYLIIPNDEKYYEINSKDIKEFFLKVDNFFDSIEKILNLELIKCESFYQQFIPDNNFERNKSENYYKIDAENNCIIKFKGNSIEDSKIENDKLKNLSIRDILPDFYECKILDKNKSKKKKSIPVCSNVSCKIL